MKKNDPRRNLIQTWCWGNGTVDVYVGERGLPRWVLNKGALSSPCEVPGCKRHIFKGEWYVRHPEFSDPFCRDCAEGFGAVPPDAITPQSEAR